MGHGHAHLPASTGTRLLWALGATGAFVLAEGLVGSYTGSLALLSDAGHNLADGLALGLAWYAHHISSRAADARRTYGYHRVGVLAALLNAVVLVGISLAILWEAWVRLHAPTGVPGLWIMATAAVALGVNLLISMWLHRGSAHDVNIRGAYLHMLADAASSAGVIVAGLIVYLTHWNAVDAIASIAIAVLILWSTWGILLESVGILLEAAPTDLDMAAVATAITGVPGVMGVHDLHAWTLGSGIVACSCHILVADQTASGGQEVVRQVAERLKDFRIAHTTIQLEVTPCTPEEAGALYCVGAEAPHDDHAHAGHDHGGHAGHSGHSHAGHDHAAHAHAAPAPVAPGHAVRVAAHDHHHDHHDHDHQHTPGHAPHDHGHDHTPPPTVGHSHQ